MLRIEKDRHVSLRFKVRERMFTKTFLQALAIALGLHILALLVFHVRLFQIVEAPWTFPPALVDAEMQKSGNDSASRVMATIEQEKVIFRGIPPSKATMPQFPILTDRAPSLPLPTPSLTAESPTLFTQIETTAKTTYLPLPRSEPIHLQISGPLANHPLQNHKLNSIKTKLALSTPLSLKYTVQLDPRSGRILWLTPDHPLHTPPIEQIGREIISSLRFTTSDTASITTGQIELYLYPEKSS